MTKKILVIDDDRGNVKLIQSALEKRGFEIFSAFDGKEGLMLLPTVNPDLIILDVEMPIMNGYMFMMNLKDNVKYQSTSVIVLTAHANNQPIFQLRKVKHYLVKPINVELLLEKIFQCLAAKIEIFDTKVLIIENNATQIKLMAHYVDKAGFKNLIFANNAHEGIEKARLTNPDVVVIRDKLPDMNGYEVAEKLGVLDEVTSKMIFLGDKDEDVDQFKLNELHVSNATFKSAKYEFLIETIKNLI